MLVLSRRVGERSVVDGGIVVTVVRVKSNQVRIGLEAPPRVGIYREEVLPGVAAGTGRGGEVSAV
jgi:carbon storage regulator